MEPGSESPRVVTDPAAGAEPVEQTVEAWCFALVTGEELQRKLDPPELPYAALDRSTDDLAWEVKPPSRRLVAPGRPPELRTSTRSPRTPKGQALKDKAVRAQLVHTFLHHELQAAELFAWAVLAFPDTPEDFRRGLIRLCLEELGHLRLYEEHLLGLDAKYGDFPVRDWFWERVPSCESALQFVALVGLGLEGANLEHSVRFADAFRAVGDEEGARVLELVERDEIGHVAFAAKWFRTFSGGLDFERWAAELPAPLTPSLLRGRPLNRKARLAAGLDEEFLAELDAAPATSRSRGKA